MSPKQPVHAATPHLYPGTSSEATVPSERQALVDAAREQPVTLDGEPAVVSGSHLPYARVQRKDGRGGAVEYAWPTVGRILTAGGAFQS